MHVVLAHGDPAAIAVLVAQPLEDPLGDVLLLGRLRLILLQDAIDDPPRTRPAWAALPDRCAGIPAAPRTPASLRLFLDRSRSAAPPAILVIATRLRQHTRDFYSGAYNPVYSRGRVALKALSGRPLQK
jgi:hypothetical protein